MSLAPVIFDSFTTTPEFAPLRDAVKVGDWARFERAIAALSPDVAGTALTQLAEVDGIENFLERALAADRSSALARTALGARYIVIAWAARSRNIARNVTQEQFQEFFDWLTKADALLTSVHEDTPGFAPAWASSLTSARGLQLGADEVLRRNDALAAVSPNDYPGQIQTLVQLLPKWGGSWDAATSFVDESLASAPDGSNTHALVAIHHIERWAAADGDGTELLKTPAVLAGLRDAAAHISARLDPVTVQAHNAFVMAFWLGDHREDAAVHVRALGGRASEFPWRYVSGTPKTLEGYHRYVTGEKKKWFGR